MNVRFLLGANSTNLRLALAESIKNGRHTGTIEAEYGPEDVVQGNSFTLAHHGLRANQPAPTTYPNGFARIGGKPFEGDIGLSHVDFDTEVGAAAVLEKKPEDDIFWKLVELYDVKGLHKVPQSEPRENDLRRLYAYLAWDSKNKMFANRDGSVSIVTTEIEKGVDVIGEIVANNDTLLRAGDDYRQAQAKLNAESFRDFRSGVIFRESDTDVNHLYLMPNGEEALAVVTFKPGKQKITLSFADLPKGKNAIDILTELFPGAGGHAQIAGSPRDQKMTYDNAIRVFANTIESIK